MIKEIKVPAMGESIAEATIGEILAPSGSYVKVDAEILELETDKVNQVIYAPAAGKLSLNVKPGEVVKIGQVLGTLETDAPNPNAEAITSKPVEKLEKKVKPTEAPPKIQKQASSETTLRYSKEDFISAISKTDETIEPVPVSKDKEIRSSNKRETRRKMTKIRKVIANRLLEAQRTTAMLTTFNEIDMSAVIDLREKYKETFLKKYQTKLGFMSFFVKASVAALQVFPDLNSYIDGEEIVHREYYDIGIAVGTEKGLIVPVVRNCDELTFSDIEKAIEQFSKRAKSGELTLDELQGGGFTITNGGVYGSLLSTPILNPPQSGILGMHKIEKRAVVINDQVVIRPMMYVALSYDHRIVDGKEAVSFLVHLKNLLEDPSRLLLDI